MKVIKILAKFWGFSKFIYLDIGLLKKNYTKNKLNINYN